MPTMNSMNTPNRTTSPAARLAALTGALALSTLAVTGAVASSVTSAAQPVSAAEASSQDSAQPVTPTNVPGPAGEIGKGGEDPLITFSETAEPMELTALVDFVANTLGINISVRGELRNFASLMLCLPTLETPLGRRPLTIGTTAPAWCGHVPCRYFPAGNPYTLWSGHHGV